MHLMNEVIDSDPSSPQELLKWRLLEGGLDFSSFLKQVMVLDQQGMHIENAQANIELLMDPKVLVLLAVLDDDTKENYFNMLSLSHFHRGQGMALHQEGDPVDQFRKAHQASLNISPEGGYARWQAYVAGTVAYFEKDTDRLKKILQDNSELDGQNRVILENLLKSLEQGEGPVEAYVQAYSAPIIVT